MKKSHKLIVYTIFVAVSWNVTTVFSENEPQLKSIEQLEKEYKEQPKNHIVNYDYCGKLIEYKKYDTAIDVCTVAIETGNENTLSWSFLNRGIAYMNLGNTEKAKEDRQKAKNHGMPDWLLNQYLKL